MPTVDFVYDLDCPNVASTRTNLMRALSSEGLAVRWQEHHAGDPTSPDRTRGFGSPTILVDGEDIAGAKPSAGASCRIYEVDGASTGTPPVDMIARALARAAMSAPPSERPRRSRFKAMAAVLPGVGVAFLPKVVCPLCWPAYAAVLSATGLTFLMEDKWLFPISVVVLLMALAAMSWRAKTRRGYAPALVGSLAAALLLVGKFALESDATMYGGIAILIAAAIWNAWPRRSSTPNCPACVSAQPSSP